MKLLRHSLTFDLQFKSEGDCSLKFTRAGQRKPRTNQSFHIYIRNPGVHTKYDRTYSDLGFYSFVAVSLKFIPCFTITRCSWCKKVENKTKDGFLVYQWSDQLHSDVFCFAEIPKKHPFLPSYHHKSFRNDHAMILNPSAKRVFKYQTFYIKMRQVQSLQLSSIDTLPNFDNLDKISLFIIV